MNLSLRTFVAAIITATLILPSAHAFNFAAAPIEVTGLETNATAQPLGLDDPTPRFTWRLNSSTRGVVQKQYRVLVASRPGLVKEGQTDVWDSRTVTSSGPWVIYGGPAL